MSVRRTTQRTGRGNVFSETNGRGYAIGPRGAPELGPGYIKGTGEKTTARVGSMRYKVAKNGVTLGGHDELTSARKLAKQLGGEVVGK